MPFMYVGAIGLMVFGGLPGMIAGGAILGLLATSELLDAFGSSSQTRGTDLFSRLSPMEAEARANTARPSRLLEVSPLMSRFNQEISTPAAPAFSLIAQRPLATLAKK